MAEVKKANWFVRAWRGVCKYFRELRSELKKVVWPTANQVGKNTGVVVVCCLIICAFIWAFDVFAGAGINLLLGLF